MSNYPVWWESTVTIYNRYEDVQTHIVTWYRTVVSDCFWKNAGNKVTVGNVVLETNGIICRIPENVNFREQYAWRALPSDVRANYFTIGLEDIIVKGEVEDTINEHESGHRSTDLLAKYKALQGCMQVEQCSINVGAGRCEPHYYVRGV